MVRHNYGFCGREFVEQGQLLGFEEIRRIQREYAEKIQEYAKEQGNEKEEKQVLPMSIILAADEIAEKYLFQDGIRLDLGQCCDLLKNKGEVSEHQRAYQFLKETIATNPSKFANDPDSKTEQWGIFLEGDQYAVIVGKIFDRLMKEAGFQSKAFLSWAKKNGVIKTDPEDHPKVVTKINGCSVRCVLLNMDTENGEFTQNIDDCPFS
jgi:hypothetical protein